MWGGRYAHSFKQREFLQLHCLHFFGVPSFESKDLDRCLGDTCFLSPNVSNTQKRISINKILLIPNNRPLDWAIGQVAYKEGCDGRADLSGDATGPPYIVVKSSCLGTAFLVGCSPTWEAWEAWEGVEIAIVAWDESMSIGRISGLQTTVMEDKVPTGQGMFRSIKNVPRNAHRPSIQCTVILIKDGLDYSFLVTVVNLRCKP